MRLQNSPRTFISLGLAAWVLCCPVWVIAQESQHDQVFATPPFSLQDDVIKTNSKGVDVESILAKALKKKPPIKTEYETNSDFEGRLAKFSEEAFPKQIAAGNRFAIIKPLGSFPLLWRGGNPTVETRYSAETENMTVRLYSHSLCLPLKRSTKSKRQYSASNRFGQKVTVVEVDEFETCIYLEENSATKIDDLTFNLSISKKDAHKVTHSLSFVIIGKLAPPYASEEREHEQPKMDSPIEINSITKSLAMQIDDVWIVDIASGKVLAKHKSSFRDSDPSLAERLDSRGGCNYPTYRKSELPNFNLVVELEYFVKSDGTIEYSSIKKSTGIDELDKRALQSISGCRFRPGTKDGVAVDGATIVKFHFDDYHAGNY